MTENEAIERIKTMAFMCDDFHNCKYGHDCTDGCSEAVKMAVDALQGSVKKKHIGKDNMVISSSDLMTILNSDSEELKKYKEVGTVEEFKALKEKSVAKKPFQPFGTHSYKCSNCWKFVAHEVDDNCDLSSLAEWCPYCGSRIDWSE